MELAPGTRRRLIVGGAALLLLLLVLAGRGFRRDRVAGHAFAIPSRDDAIQVEVLNASGVDGLARLGTRQLRQHGIDVVLFDTYRGPHQDTTRVIVRRGAAEQANRVRDALGTGKVEQDTDTLRRVDVTVLLGPDWQPDASGRP